MLQFNPDRRVSVDEALKHPYFKSLHNPKKEVECKDIFDFAFEKEKMTGESLRDFMWEEILQFRSELKEVVEGLKNKERAIRKQLAAHGGAPPQAQAPAAAAAGGGGGAPAAAAGGAPVAVVTPAVAPPPAAKSPAVPGKA